MIRSAPDCVSNNWKMIEIEKSLFVTTAHKGKSFEDIIWHSADFKPFMGLKNWTGMIWWHTAHMYMHPIKVQTHTSVMHEHIHMWNIAGHREKTWLIMHEHSTRKHTPKSLIRNTELSMHAVQARKPPSAGGHQSFLMDETWLQGRSVRKRVCVSAYVSVCVCVCVLVWGGVCM